MMARMRMYALALMAVVSLAGFVRGSRDNNARPAAQTYRRYCVSCHGTDGKAKTSKGKYSHARDLTDAEGHADVSDELIFKSIINGRNKRGNMPAFADKLNEKEVNSLVSFVRGLKAQ